MASTNALPTRLDHPPSRRRIRRRIAGTKGSRPAQYTHDVVVPQEAHTSADELRSTDPATRSRLEGRRPAPRELGRGTQQGRGQFPGGEGRPWVHDLRRFLVLEGDQRGQLRGGELQPGPCWAATTSTAATAPDTPRSVAGLATVFGAGGGTSSYREAEDTDLIVLWGSNARETHPIFFHHLLRGIRKGARLYAIDPRRTSSAEWADVWMGLTSAATSPSPTRSAARSSPRGWRTRSSSTAPPTASTPTGSKVESYTLCRQRRSPACRRGDRELAHACAKAVGR